MTSSPRRRPANRSHLERLISEAAKRNGISPARLRRWISQMIVTGALSRGRGDDDVDVRHGHQGVIAIKGGVTMELRFGLRARATKDLDAVVVTSPDDAEQAIRDCLARPYEGFAFQVAPSESITGEESWRCEVKLAYEGRSWSTERLEYSLGSSRLETESLPGIDLSPYGLQGPASVSSLALRWQIAQKLHAVTASWEDEDNPRFRDLVDLLLLEGRVTDFRALRSACIEVFEDRATHPWPAVVVAPDSWREAYAALATELGIEPVEVDRAVRDVNAFIRRIDAAM